MGDIQHSSRKHALLSASGATRWLNCTPSARMEEEFKQPEISSYAAEGTLAHEFADINLQLGSYVGKVGKNSPKQKMLEQLTELRKSDLYTGEMEDQVTKYTDYVFEEWLAARKKTEDAILKIEEKVDLREYIEEGFGTCDAIVIADGVMEVIDLKYGKGVKVLADNNPQLRLYALGALHIYAILFDIHTVKMTIVQPRLDSISSDEISADDLFDWGEVTVKPTAKKAYAGKGDCNPGDWCRWCKAKPKCRALADYNMDLVKSDFADPKTLSDEEILEVYEKSSMLTDWAASVNQYMLTEALNGKEWEGYKVVEGRANRKWGDEEKALEALQEEGFTSADLTNTKIKAIGQVEKLVGKSKFAGLDLTIKPQGKPALVPESDKRPAMGIEQAKKDFE